MMAYHTNKQKMICPHYFGPPGSFHDRPETPDPTMTPVYIRAFGT
jgi:hypothetical protein